MGVASSVVEATHTTTTTAASTSIRQKELSKSRFA